MKPPFDNSLCELVKAAERLDKQCADQEKANDEPRSEPYKLRYLI